jgi:hypothetical protein
MKINKYLIIILSIVCLSGRSKKIEEPQPKDTLVLFYKKNWVKIKPYSNEERLNESVNELRDSLKNNKVADFFMDECLDASSMGYCLVSYHETISLRADIIKKLTQEEMKKIIAIGDTVVLKKKCEENYDGELVNYEKSTYDLLMEAIY